MRFSLILIFVGANPTLIARARIGILGASSTARAGNAPAALGRSLQPVLAKWVWRVVKNEPRAGTRPDDEDDRD